MFRRRKRSSKQYLADPYPDGKVKYYDDGRLIPPENASGASSLSMQWGRAPNWKTDPSYHWAQQVKAKRGMQ